VTKTFTVSDMPNVSLTMDTMICSYTPPFNLTGGLPSGGTYYVDGSLSSVFNPALLGVGDHDVVYKVVSGSCIAYDTVSVSISICTGTNGVYAQPPIELYPNPATGEVILTTPQSSEGWSIEFYNAFGVCVKKIHCDQRQEILHTAIDVHTFSRGIYWLVIKNDSERYFEKLVLE
jgi:hypothetical protein